MRKSFLRFGFVCLFMCAFACTFAKKPSFSGKNAAVFESTDFSTEFMILTAINKTMECIELDLYAYDEANGNWIRYAEAKVEDQNDTDNFSRPLKYKLDGWKTYRYYAVQAKNVKKKMKFEFENVPNFFRIYVYYK